MMALLKKLACFVAALFFVAQSLFAQEMFAGAQFQTAPGIAELAADIEARSTAKGLPDRIRVAEELSTKKYVRPVRNPGSPNDAFYPNVKVNPLPGQNNVTQTIHSNFQAIGINESGFLPPDNMGDVGTTQICIASNGRIKFYDKTTVCQPARVTNSSAGSTSLGSAAFSADLDVFFESVRNSSSTTDPRVHFDRLSQRWFVVCINTSNTKNRILIAVSNGPTITAQSNFSFFFFVHDQGTTSGQNDNNAFCDYPMMGLDKHALYIGGVIFSAAGSYLGASCYVVNKAALIAGGPAVVTAFRRVGSTSTGIYVPQGVSNDDPDATRGYFVGTDAGFFGRLRYLVVTDPGGTPSAALNTLNVSSTSFPIDQPASGSTQPLDASDFRLLNAALVRNKVDGRQSIFTAHTIGVKQDGVADNDNANRNAQRWYELAVNGATLSLRQSGTLFDNAASFPTSYIYGAISGSGQGHALMGATSVGASVPANVALAGRYNTQTLSQLSPVVNATTFSESYNQQTDETQRWGDYSQTVCDPSDDMTIWTFQQYTNTTNGWAVRATQVKAPPPATATAITPIACNDTRSQTVALSGQSINFSGFYDPGADPGGPGYNRRLQVSSTGGVVISNITFTNPTQIGFTLNYAAAALGSQQTLTVTNPDCQATTFQYTLPTGCGPLPVKWLGITAQWVGTQAKVEWRVAEERNNLAYEIERSSNGRNFATLNRVNSTNQTAATAYTYNDAQPGAENFYRIKQIDRDGGLSYSAVVYLGRKSVQKLQITPNPAKDKIMVFLPESQGQLRLMDMSGKILRSTTANSNLVSIGLENLSGGLYWVEFTGATKTERLRVVKQ
jgi:hypothetical protein